MIAIPILVKLAYGFLARTDSQIQMDYAFSAYLFLCSIFVAMTNQVSDGVKLIWHTCACRAVKIRSKFFAFRFTNGHIRIGDCQSGWYFYKIIT